MRPITTLLMTILILVAWALPAAAASVPPYLVYQSQLFDDGGNPIPDGPVGITLRITDVGGAILYEEAQTVDAIDGAVAAVVGAGAADPIGGVPADLFAGGASRYLEVEVEGVPPTPPMEIASVPYAFYAQEALGAAEGAIDGRAIADGSIGIADVGADFVDGLAAELTGGGTAESFVVREELETLYRAPSAAATIGVEPQFLHSGANDLQGVLADFDLAIQRRDERIAAEEAARVAAVNTEASVRVGQVNALSMALGTETQQRIDADSQRVLKSGDTMSGSLDVAGTVRVRTDEKGVPQDRTLYGNALVLAWGSVDENGTLQGGFNCTSSRDANNIYHIAFLRQAADAHSYAAVVTFHDRDGDPSYNNPIIYEKKRSGFKVAYHGDGDGTKAEPFSFVAIGY